MVTSGSETPDHRTDQFVGATEVPYVRRLPRCRSSRARTSEYRIEIAGGNKQSHSGLPALRTSTQLSAVPTEQLSPGPMHGEQSTYRFRAGPSACRISPVKIAEYRPSKMLVGLQDQIVDKLKLLNYEQDFCKPK